MRFVALLFALVVGAFATMFILQTGQFSPPGHEAPAADAQAAPAAPDGAAPDGAATAPGAGAQSPGSVIAAVAGNTRAVAASAAKSPKTVAATLTQKPQAAATASQQPQAAAAAASLLPARRIRPPQGLEGVAFGMSPQQISARYPPSWRRETMDELVLVYYPDQRGDQVRFHFGPRGLKQLELQVKPPNGEKMNAFYQQVKAQYAAIYGNPPGSADGAWNDGQTVLQINYGATAVSVCFTPNG